MVSVECTWHTRQGRAIIGAILVVFALWPGPAAGQVGGFRLPAITGFDIVAQLQTAQAPLGPGALTLPPPGGLAVLRTPYALYGNPVVDFSGDFIHRSPANNNDGFYQTLITGDLFYMNARLSMVGGDNPLAALFGDIDPDADDAPTFFFTDDGDLTADIRLEFNRRDPNRNLFPEFQNINRLGLTEIVIGDITAPTIPVLAVQIEGRGILISSFPLDMATDLDRHTLRGDLPPGWSVELFRGNAMLGTAVPDPNGRYEFSAMPLLSGDNRFRVEFYGPQGQRRTEFINVPTGLGPANGPPRSFRLSFSEDNTRVFRFADNQQDGRPRLLAEYEERLLPNFTLRGVATSLELPDGDRDDTFGLGGRTQLAGQLLRFDAFDDMNSGWGYQAGIQGSLFDIDYAVEHTRGYGLESEPLGVFDPPQFPPYERITEIRLDKVIPEIGMAPEITVNLSYINQIDTEGFFERISSFGVATNFGETFITHDLLIIESGDPFTAIPTDMSGTAFVTSNLQRGPGFTGDFLETIHLTGTLDYTLQPERLISGFGFTSETFLPDNWSARFNVTREINPVSSTILEPGLSRDFATFTVGASGKFVNDGEQTFMLSMTFGAGVDPRTGHVVSQPLRFADQGVVSVRAFIDANANNRFDIGETAIPGMPFRADLQPELLGFATDAQGIAFVTGLPTFQEVVIAVDVSVLPGFAVPASLTGVAMVPRPGVITTVDLPVVPLIGMGSGTPNALAQAGTIPFLQALR